MTVELELLTQTSTVLRGTRIVRTVLLAKRVERYSITVR